MDADHKRMPFGLFTELGTRKKSYRLIFQVPLAAKLGEALTEKPVMS